MIPLQLTADEAKFLSDCIAARRCSLREAVGDAMNAGEREAFLGLLKTGESLYFQLLTLSASERRLAGSAQ